MKLAKEIQLVEKELSDQFGDFALVALLLREDSPDRWDLLISAPWSKDAQSTLKEVVAHLKKHLNSTETAMLSRVVILNPMEPIVKTFNSAIRTEHGMAEIKDSTFNNIPIKHAYVITSKHPPKAAPLRN